MQPLIQRNPENNHENPALLRRSPHSAGGPGGGTEHQPDGSAERAHRHREAEATLAAQRPAASRNSGRAGDRAQRQKTPDKFAAKVGEKVPTALKLDAMPAPLINQEPVLKQYDFVKLDKDLLVVDPMDSTIVAVIPRKFPQGTGDARQRAQWPDPRPGVAGRRSRDP